LDFRDNVRAFFFTPSGDDDFGAGTGEFDRGGFADAGGSAGHEGNFAREFLGVRAHVLFL